MDEMPPMVDASPATNHIAKHLGKIIHAWALTEEAASSPYWLVQYEREPEDDWVIIGTYGLCRIPLYQENGSAVRQELLMTCPRDQVSEARLSHLESIASAMLEGQEALGLGETLFMPSKPIIESGCELKWEAIFITSPFFLPETALVYEDLDAPLVLTWLIPLYQSEMMFVGEQGIDAFNQIILENRNALFSWPRPKMTNSLYVDGEY